MKETLTRKLLQSPRGLWLLNAVIFQVGWFVCILGGSLWAAGFTLPMLLLHWRYCRGPHPDGLAVAVALIIGLVHDNLLVELGVLVFPGGGFSPPWLWCLWLLLGITLNHSLAWIYHRPLVSAIVGAVCGPLSYSAGIALSDAAWGMPLLKSILIMGTLWLFVLPIHRFFTYRISHYVIHP